MATLSHNLDMEKASPSDDHVEDIDGHHHRGGLSEEDAEFMHGFSEERRKRVVRKIDWRLVPFLGVLYLLGYLDRANIGMCSCLHLYSPIFRLAEGTQCYLVRLLTQETSNHR